MRFSGGSTSVLFSHAIFNSRIVRRKINFFYQDCGGFGFKGRMVISLIKKLSGVSNTYFNVLATSIGCIILPWSSMASISSKKAVAIEPGKNNSL